MIPRDETPNRLPKGQARKQKDTPSRQRRAAKRTAVAIQNTATKRQEVWTVGDQPRETYRLTVELDDLYGDLRDERKGNPGEPYRGRTAAVRS